MVVFGEIRRLGLAKNVVEIEEQGFTVVENALAADMVEGLREVILRQSSDKTGKELDLHNWDDGTVREGCYLLYEDPIFEKLAQNEYTVALMRYLLGRSMVLSTMVSHVRAKGDPSLRLHTDQWTLQLSNPVSVAVANYALVDYERDLGAFAVVPGSNQFLRRPVSEEESNVYTNPDCVPLEMKAGSVVVTAGCTWHGCYERKVPGLRVNAAVAYCRSYIRTQEFIREGVTQEMLDRNPPEFADLLGVNNFLGFGREGPDFGKRRPLLGRFD
ncbi:MAG: phytanoyl-CoA dioxygenase family protein [Gammaproteobacteria bacterium]|nr:phytanoyl-CoA dioxygenase family protein [Gammaproteobacteria bacterium]